MIILLIWYALAMLFLFRPLVYGQDTVGYFSWLRSAVCDHDLNVANEFAYFSTQVEQSGLDVLFNLTTPTGYQYSQWTAGSAVLWLPLYTLAHGGVALSHAAGAAIVPNGYSWPYQVAASVSSTLYGLAAVLMTYRIARHYFSLFVATLATWVIWFATPLVFYMFTHPFMSHVNDAFASTVIVYVWWHTRDRNTTALRNGVFIGLAIGLATWVRTQNGAFLAAPLVVAGVESIGAFRRGTYALIWARLRQMLGVGLGFALFLLPLMLFWKHVYGAWIVNVYGLIRPPDIFDWSAPHIGSIFFSTNRGMFIWAPVTLFALAGLWWLRRLDARLTLFLGVMFMTQLYIIGSWFEWAGAASFGPRFWTNMVLLFTLGLAALLAQMQSTPRWILLALGTGFVVWNLLLLVQYALHTIPRSGPVDIATMVRNQFLVIPTNLDRVIRALIQRN